MTRAALKSHIAFRPAPAAPETPAAPEDFVMVGDEKVTKPNEVAFIRLYRSLPDGLKPAATRYVKNVARGMGMREAAIAFSIETGSAPEDAERTADALCAECRA